MSFNARAPGSIMLLGEHAVLHGGPAVVAAIDRYINVSLTPRNDRVIDIHSKTLGTYITHCDCIEIKTPFTFVLATLEQQNIIEGCTIHIDSDFSDKLGLGSSAAVTVATLRAIDLWQEKTVSKRDLLHRAINVILRVQGIGSGADCAASVYGGIVYYQRTPQIIELLSPHPPIGLLYAGYKTPTTKVIEQVAKTYLTYPSLYDTLYQHIAQCAIQGKSTLLEQKWHSLGQLFDQQQQLMVALGVSDAHLDQLIEKVRGFNSVFGAKISGAGLGDCIVTLGKFPMDQFIQSDEQKRLGTRPISINIAPETSACS